MRLNASLVFADESGFLLVPPVLKTWAPRGATPVLRHRTRRDKVSVISAISVSPQRTRLGLYYDFYTHNIRHQEGYAFLRQLLRHLRGPVIVLLDNADIHTAAPLRRLCARPRRLHLEYFPAYAPELNPDEGVWTLTKRALTNGRPAAVPDLLPHLCSGRSRIFAGRRACCAAASSTRRCLFFCAERCILYAPLNSALSQHFWRFFSFCWRYLAASLPIGV